ncbi:MAG: hydroxymethylbilane synthase [Desulfovibrionaceae bacterium]|nr:hydroxymethylbilane synthase [Desulfovibrionaceae bacterium]
MEHLTIATRGSRLALWQANHVQSLLCALHPELSVSLLTIKTKGDIIQDVPLSRVGGKGLFVKEIEEALLEGKADIAVHSIKDVPMVLPKELLLGCIPERAEADDLFLSFRYQHFADLPKGARIGTSSLRRQSQLLAQRKDLTIVSLRGNVDTRMRKLEQGDFDALILAACGVRRLGLCAPYMESLPHSVVLPAVGQGALGIECRHDRYDVLCLLAELEDSEARVRVTAERSFLARLDGGCQVPIAAHAKLKDNGTIELAGLVGEVDGSRVIAATLADEPENAEAVGTQLAEQLLKSGASEILEKLYSVR